ncbi:MAG: ATP-binding protein [Candidatus Margulisiibacteriota bacterium]
MINTIEELLQSIKDGTLIECRHENIEIKSSWQKDYGSKISALGNKKDLKQSWMIIGVDDDGKLVGHNASWAKNTEEIISQQINAFLDPTQTCVAMGSYAIEGNNICVIKIKNPGAVVNVSSLGRNPSPLGDPFRMTDR